MKVNCIAIDDEPLALDKIREYIDRVGYLNLVASFDNGIDAIEFIRENQVDLLYLDIQMEELTGIQMLESLKVKPKVVLTTAYESYALKGYELDVIDYLLKPISFQRFLKATEKVYDILIHEKNAEVVRVKEISKSGKSGYFFVKTGSSTKKVNFDDILFVEGMKDYLRIWTSEEKIMTLLSFKKLESVLPAANFIRIHKSFLVSIDKIQSVERNRVRIGGELLPVGESYKRQFQQIIQDKRLN